MPSLSPSSPYIAGWEALVVALLALLFGYSMVNVLSPRRSLDTVTKWGLAFPALVVYVLLLMIAHIVSGGLVLSSAWVSRGVTAGLLVLLLTITMWRRVRRPAEGASHGERSTVAVVALGAVSLLAVAVWGSPVFRVLPLYDAGDTVLHMGWASQIANGEATPSAPLTGAVPNYYPWLFHALVAFVAWFTPGGRAWHALGPVQIMQVAGSTMSLFALGSWMTKKWLGGVAVAILGGLSGGFGFLLLEHGPDVILGVRQADSLRYMGDLLFKRSYNASFFNLSPPFPRDVAVALLPAVLLLAGRGLAEERTRLLLAAGVVLGAAGLTGAEAFLVGLLALVLVSLFARDFGRMRCAAAMLVPALCVWALWVAPLVVNYVRLGGFKSLAGRPVQLPVEDFLVTWGVVAVFALWGIFLVVRRTLQLQPRAFVPLCLLLAASLVLTASQLAPGLFGPGFKTLGRAHRYWPVVHLGLALVAAFGVTDLMARAWFRSRVVAAGLALVTVAVSLPSPLAASLALPAKVQPKQVLTLSLEGDPHTYLNLLSPRPGSPCVVAVPLLVGHPVWAYTGYRQVLFNWVGEDWGHIRWRHIWRYITRLRQRLKDNRALTTGDASRRTVEALIRRYSLDAAIVFRAANARGFSSYERTPASRPGSLSVVRTSSCTR